MECSDRITLIPGANRPIGRAIARRFAAAGAHLVLPVYHDWPESTAEMVEEFERSGFSFITHPCDLTQPAETKDLFDLITKKYSHLHYLINNIERGGMPVVHGSYLAPHNKEQWQLEFDTTLRAKWLLVHYGLPLLKAAKEGAVVTLSSIAALIGRSGPAAPLFNDGYSAANRGIGSLTEQWAREAAPEIRVNEVMLGLVAGRHGEQTRGWQALRPEERQALLDHTLLGRTGTPEEIGELVYFIAVKAAFLTGAIIRVDGGYCLGGEQPSPLPPGILSA